MYFPFVYNQNIHVAGQIDFSTLPQWGFPLHWNKNTLYLSFVSVLTVKQSDSCITLPKKRVFQQVLSVWMSVSAAVKWTLIGYLIVRC